MYNNYLIVYLDGKRVYEGTQELDDVVGKLKEAWTGRYVEATTDSRADKVTVETAKIWRLMGLDGKLDNMKCKEFKRVSTSSQDFESGDRQKTARKLGISQQDLETILVAFGAFSEA